MMVLLSGEFSARLLSSCSLDFCCCVEREPKVFVGDLYFRDGISELLGVHMVKVSFRDSLSVSGDFCIIGVLLFEIPTSSFGEYCFSVDDISKVLVLCVTFPIQKIGLGIDCSLISSALGEIREMLFAALFGNVCFADGISMGLSGDVLFGDTTFTEEGGVGGSGGLFVVPCFEFVNTFGLRDIVKVSFSDGVLLLSDFCIAAVLFGVLGERCFGDIFSLFCFFNCENGTCISLDWNDSFVFVWPLSFAFGRNDFVGCI